MPSTHPEPKPRISVVIPLFNKERRIGAALSSVLGQRSAPEQIVVVDDGSTDHGPALVAELASRSGRAIEVVSTENFGVAAARNVGVAKARCDFVAFLDADDEWDPAFLERMSALIKDFPEAVLFGAAHARLRHGGSTAVIVRPRLAPGFRGYVPDFFLASLGGGIANSSKVVIRKSALLAIGGFPEGVRAGEDLYVWMRLAATDKVAFDDFVGATIHQEPDQSRGRRSGEVSYPLVYYSASADHRRELSPSAYRFLWKIFYTHFFAALVAGERGLAGKVLERARIIMPMVVLFRAFFLFPHFAFDWLATLTGRGRST